MCAKRSVLLSRKVVCGSIACLAPPMLSLTRGARSVVAWRPGARPSGLAKHATSSHGSLRPLASNTRARAASATRIHVDVMLSSCPAGLHSSLFVMATLGGGVAATLDAHQLAAGGAWLG